MLKERNATLKTRGETINRVDLKNFPIITFASKRYVLMNNDVTFCIITSTTVTKKRSNTSWEDKLFFFFKSSPLWP